MQYNPNNGNPIFACYASDKPQKPVYLYEKDGEAALPQNVTLNANGYATFASTSPVDFTDAETTGGYTAWAVTGISGTEVTFTQIDYAVAAGTGVFLKGTASSDVKPVYTATGTTVSGNKLVGITTATDVTAGEYFGLKGNEFVPVNAGTVPAGKALLPATEVPSEIKAFTFVFNGADGIQTVETSGWMGYKETITEQSLKNDPINSLKRQLLLSLTGVVRGWVQYENEKDIYHS